MTFSGRTGRVSQEYRTFKARSSEVLASPARRFRLLGVAEPWRFTCVLGNGASSACTIFYRGHHRWWRMSCSVSAGKQNSNTSRAEERLVARPSAQTAGDNQQAATAHP